MPDISAPAPATEQYPLDDDAALTLWARDTGPVNRLVEVDSGTFDRSLARDLLGMLAMVAVAVLIGIFGAAIWWLVVGIGHV